MKSWVFRLVPVLLLVWAGVVSAGKSSIPIVLDAVADPVEHDSIRIELIAGIPAGRVGSTGPLLVNIRARDNHGHTLAEIERVEPAPHDTTGDRVLSWTFAGRPGKLEARVRLKTLDDRQDEGQAEFEMDVPDFSKEPYPVSTPSLLTLPHDSTDSSGGYRFLPSHILRTETDDLVLRFMEVGCLLGRAGCPTVRFILRRGSKQVSDSTFTKGMRPADLEIRQDPKRLGAGQYKYQVTIAWGGESVKREGTFQIAIGGADLLHDPVLVRTVLGYIATGAERSEIEVASPDSLVSVWERFWKRRDPTPGTASNEALNRFVDRVTQATNRFGGVVPGWRSDRGRILIQHGAPDRSERVFDQFTRTATEIWYYDQRNVSYVFQDPEGFGNYKLTGGQ